MNIGRNLNQFIDLKNEQTNARFRSYSNVTKNGQSKDYRTPFYRQTLGTINQETGKLESPPRQKVLDSWIPQLKALSQEFPGLWEYEMEMASKVGPLSIQAPLEKRLDSVHEYWKAITLPSKPISKAALSAVIKEWQGISGLTLRSQMKTVDKMKLSTASGTPYLGKRRDTLDRTVPCQNYIGEFPNVDLCIGKSISDSKNWNTAALLGWSGREGGPLAEDVKQRVIFMFPFCVNIQELQCYQPLIESAQKLNLVPAWNSMDAVDQRMTDLFDTKGKQELLICTDFTKFDQHFNRDMANAVQYLLTALLQNNAESRDWIKNVFPIKYYIPLICGDVFYYGRHGMGSGSGGTNADETLGHRALQYEAAQEIRSKLNPNSMCLGDDGVISFPGISVDLVTEVYSRHGQVMNPDKQEASDHQAVFLRRWYDSNYRINGICRGVYATTRAIGRLCGQERFYDDEIWGPKAVVIRYLSVIENCKYHPLFHKFVDWCIKGDKYRLGIDIPGFYASIGREANKLIDEIPDFLGYVRSQQASGSKTAGIENWEVVKYIRNNYDCK
uniref:RNA-dependent RNA polymerase n=1 Tax=Tasmanian devil-associated picobirnavirus 6 TaxID=2529458 RepID=A0A481W7A3_9VIRU|nr:MAG: RNA-dependent RNA polymerase [Tasmanian devil-associated picobirnavirus 6]